MAADERLERHLSSALHAWLDPAAGPHPSWLDSPVSLAVAAGRADRPGTRRVPRTALLLAAAIAIGIAIVGFALVGGRLQAPPPTIGPDRGVVVRPSTEPGTTPAPTSAPSPDAGRPAAAPPTATCLTEWSHRGTVSPVGLVDGIRTVEFEGSEGSLLLAFMHPIDSVARIAIGPAQPPFVTDHGRTVEVAGSAFYRLTLRGLTRPTTDSPPDMVAGEAVRPFTRTVEPPIAEARRIRTPREALPVDGPKGDSTEVWIIGVDRPSCLRVETGVDTTYVARSDGDNVVIVHFDPRPTP
jgi:hypothetical protein